MWILRAKYLEWLNHRYPTAEEEEEAEQKYICYEMRLDKVYQMYRFLQQQQLDREEEGPPNVTQQQLQIKHTKNSIFIDTKSINFPFILKSDQSASCSSF